MKIGKVTFKICATSVLSSVGIKVSVICIKDRSDLNGSNDILFCFSDMLRGGLHLRKTLL